MRVPPVPLQGPEAPAEAVEHISRMRSGSVLTLYRLLLHTPEIGMAWCELGTAVRWRGLLDGRTRELLICLVASLNGDDYEWSHHAPLAESAGVTAEQLESLPDWRSCASFSEQDRAALGWAEGVTLGRAGEEEFATASVAFTRERLVEIAAVCAYYGAVSRFLRALDVRADDELS